MNKKKMIKKLVKQNNALVEASSQLQAAGSRMYEVNQEYVREIQELKNMIKDYEEEVEQLKQDNTSLLLKEVISDEKNGAVICKWADGSETKAICSKNDEFSFSIGFNICYGKKLLGEDIYHSVSREYQKTENFYKKLTVNDKDFEAMKVYENLKSNNRGQRIAALRQWEKYDEAYRRSIKARYHYYVNGDALLKLLNN